MSTDRELLERAAKAAGLTIHAANQAGRDACGAGEVGLWISKSSTCWNPLTDDGDALRLAVKLRIYWYASQATFRCGDEHGNLSVLEELTTDPNASVRRAIVQVAAAMSDIE